MIWLFTPPHQRSVCWPEADGRPVCERTPTVACTRSLWTISTRCWRSTPWWGGPLKRLPSTDWTGSVRRLSERFLLFGIVDWFITIHQGPVDTEWLIILKSELDQITFSMMSGRFIHRCESYIHSQTIKPSTEVFILCLPGCDIWIFLSRPNLWNGWLPPWSYRFGVFASIWVIHKITSERKKIHSLLFLSERCNYLTAGIYCTNDPKGMMCLREEGRRGWKCLQSCE